ncbi:voltage-gated potassium channel [Aureococcus anophagefferens]|nr:voltage-gated potassium channel [Aureococcus anophagefferens]
MGFRAPEDSKLPQASMAKTGKQELGIAVSGAWAATLLDRWASLLGGERENNVARLVVGDVRVTAWDVSRSASTAPSTTSRRCCRRRPRPSSRSRRARAGRTPVRRELGAGVDYYPSPPPPGVGGETGAFDAGARAMLEGLLKRRFAALPDLLRALAAALKRAARTPPLPGSRRSLESVLSRVGFPDTRYLDKRRARGGSSGGGALRWLRRRGRARPSSTSSTPPATSMVLARPTRTNRLRALESLLSPPPPPDPPAPPEDAHRRPPPAPDAGPDVVDRRGDRRADADLGPRGPHGPRLRARLHRFVPVRGAPAAAALRPYAAPAADAPAPAREPAVRWRESAPAFGETAAVVMPEPVDRSDELGEDETARRRRPRGARAGAPPHGRGPLLGVAAALFRAAATDGGGVDGRAFVDATSALGPWLDSLGCGITKMVNVNVAKLEQRFGDAATVDVEVAVADEVARGAGGDDDSVFIAALWNARILNLVGRLIDDVLEADDLATDERTISAIATRAYQKTLAKHHNWSSARGGASR